MADQVNPMGGLASGLPLALLAAVSPRPAPDKVRPAKVADPKAQGPGGRPASESASAAAVTDVFEVPKVVKAYEIAKTPEAAMEQLNEYLQNVGTELKFQVDKETGRTFFKIISEHTGEVLLQVPSEEMLALARNLRALAEQAGASGVLVDKEG